MTGLFVSKEHQRRSRLRTHQAYRFIVYVLLFITAVQIPLCILRSRERSISEGLAVRKNAALDARARLSEKSAPLIAMEQKIAEARGWTACLSKRIAASEILSRIERSVPDGICLTEVSIQNGSGGLRDADCFEVELQGFSKAPEQGAWQRELQRSFSDWTVSVARSGGSAGDPLKQGLFPVTLLLKQTDTHANRGTFK